MANTTRTGSWKRLMAGFHVYTNAAGRTLAEVGGNGRKLWNAEIRTDKGMRAVKGAFTTASAAKQAAEDAYRAYRAETAAAEDLTRSGQPCQDEGTTTEQTTTEATMNHHFTRTENGETVRIESRVALAEINSAMMEPVKQGVDTMSSVRGGGYHIKYTDGRIVGFTRYQGPCPGAPEVTTPAPEDATVGEATGPARSYSYGPTRLVTVKGKTYVVGNIVPARPKTPDSTSWVPVAYVSYWSARDGEAFGPTRGTRADAKPGTTGRAIWDAVQPAAAQLSGRWAQTAPELTDM